MEVSPDVERESGDTPDHDEVGEKRDEVVLGTISTVHWHIACRSGGTSELVAGDNEREV